ncbi:MAG: efflux RND transporter periplasmic adaptor subunit [Pseudomonadota bacterium]
MRSLFLFASLLAVSGCFEEDVAASDPPVRGLKTHLVADTQAATIRRFPSVLEPTALSVLSFDLAGKLLEVDLQVGERVSAGQTLARLDPEALEIQIANSEAGVRSAQAAYDNAIDTLERTQELFERGTATRVALDTAQTDAATRKAQLEQAEAALGTAQDNLTKAVLDAPFDAIVNAVEVQSFQTVSAGATIVSLYSPDVFEVSFSANFDTTSQLVVGTPATVRLADRPDRTLQGVVSELGSRADAVSSFPVVVALEESDPILKAGMAVEVAIELPLPAQEGFSIPLTAIIQEGDIAERGGPGRAEVFVYQPDTSTIARREIQIAGVRENALLVVAGLEAGERIASAGVSFLRDGLEVKLLEQDR